MRRIVTRAAREGSSWSVPAPSWTRAPPAPRTVTLIGDHTDYNEGLSLPMAIDLATEATFTPKPGSFLVGIDSDQFPASRGRSLWMAPHRRARGAVWRPDLIAPGRTHLGRRAPGHQHHPGGRRPVVERRLLGRAAARPRPRPPTRRRAGPALPGGRGRWPASHVGLLDPLAICRRRAGHAVHIDFATLETAPGADARARRAFVIVHSEARRLLGDSPYATRRAECERAARHARPAARAAARWAT